MTELQRKVRRVPLGYRHLWWGPQDARKNTSATVNDVPTIVREYAQFGRGRIKTIWSPEFYVVVTTASREAVVVTGVGLTGLTSSPEKSCSLDDAPARIMEGLDRLIARQVRLAHGVKDDAFDPAKWCLYITHRHGDSLEKSFTDCLPEPVVPEGVPYLGGMYSVTLAEPGLTFGLGAIPDLAGDALVKRQDLRWA